jgi:glycosyltransferase involved in cell wall biosynthesis
MLQPEEDFRPLDYAEKESIKDKVSEGMEYFLFTGPVSEMVDIVSLLKAFSIFKKWQRSNMKLIISTVSSDMGLGRLQKLLASFKYRSDVELKMDASLKDATELMGAAYSFVYPALIEHFPINVLRAIRCETPVLAYELPEIRDACGDAAMYSTQGEQALSKNLQLIYRDEQYRDMVIQKGKLLMEKRKSEESIYELPVYLQQLFHKK